MDHRTLGEALATHPEPEMWSRSRALLIRLMLGALIIAVLSALMALLVWWLLTQPSNNIPTTLGAIFLAVVWAVIRIWRNRSLRRTSTPAYSHFLLAGDRHGFMANLRLGQKSVFFDGSNIVHFGLSNGIGARALKNTAAQLRSEGYRIVCFFDANIFYTLIENRLLTGTKAHSRADLQSLFDLKQDELYIVPSGVQADKYILSSLKHLPKSFSVSNDQFRDYAKRYPSVMKGTGWRKDVAIKGNEIKLLDHRFKQPVYVNQ